MHRSANQIPAMAKVHRSPSEQPRSTAAYSHAKSLFDEKREIFKWGAPGPGGKAI